MAAPDCTPTIDVTICSSGDNGDGCGGSFSMKIFPGLCGKCKLLSRVENGDQHATIMVRDSSVPFGSAQLTPNYDQAWKQCPCCGRAWKNFNPTNDRGLCSGCEQSVAMPPPPIPIRNGAPASKSAEQPAQNAQGTSISDTFYMMPSLLTMYLDGLDVADAALNGARNARSHAMDCRINKQPNQDVQPKPPSLDPNASTTEGSIFLMFEARVRRTEKLTKTPPMEGDIGKWGKSYTKTTFMSG